MLTVKDTQRATVQVCFDGSVRKHFHGPKAQERFDNELLVLRYLEKSGCDFVPRVISADPEKLLLVTSNCGSRVDQLDPQRCKELFDELEHYGVRHDDPELRNVTYRQQDGRFCLIDFEFATVLDALKSTSKPETKPAVPRLPAKSLSISWSGCSDKGPSRGNNEDSFVGLAIHEEDVRHLGKVGESSNEADLIFAVSDGMGGANAGEFASRITVEKITRMIPPLIRHRAVGTPISYGAAFEALFAEIHKALQYLGDSYEECHGMGSTLSLCWFSEEMMHFAHIGDTRIYHLSKDGTITQLTDDDTHVGWLRRTGQISELEARMHPAKNRLQKALGAGNQFVNPQVGEISCSSGDHFLICSDGITDGLSDQRIAETLKGCPKGITPAQHLASEATTSSGKDNATAVIVAIT
jgi:serine/threonine protein phosphatase PrpC